MKISFIMLGLKDYSTGGYSFNFRMAEALSNAGHDVDIVHYSTIPEKARGSRLQGSFHVFIRILRNRPDLIVISKSYSFLLPLRLLMPLSKYAILYMVHHLEWHDRAGGVSNLRRRIVRWFVSSGRKIWVNSKSTASDVVSLGISRKKIAIVPPGYERFELFSDARTGDTVNILCVGTLCPRKDQMTLVKACADLGDRKFHLWIPGDDKADPDYAEAVRREADCLGKKVIFMGHLSTPELHAMYNRSHVLANLSHWEGYGIAVAEAMWAGLPVLAVDAGAVPELVTHGDNGYLMAPGDVKGCTEHLKKLIDNRDLREEMSGRAHSRAEQLFTWHDTGREFVKLAEETAGC